MSMKTFNKLIKMNRIHKYYDAAAPEQIQIKYHPSSSYIEFRIGKIYRTREVSSFGSKRTKSLYQEVCSFNHTPTEKGLKKICSLIRLPYDSLVKPDPKSQCLNQKGREVVEKAIEEIDRIYAEHKKHLLKILQSYHTEMTQIVAKHPELPEVMALVNIKCNFLNIDEVEDQLERLHKLLNRSKYDSRGD